VRTTSTRTPAFEIARHVLQRFAAAGKLGGQVQDVAPSSLTATSNVDRVPQRRLLEEQRHVRSVERFGGRRLEAEMAVGFQLHGEIEQPDECRRRSEVEDREEVFH
jgi:hypothetical protein